MEDGGRGLVAEDEGSDDALLADAAVGPLVDVRAAEAHPLHSQQHLWQGRSPLLFFLVSVFTSFRQPRNGQTTKS